MTNLEDTAPQRTQAMINHPDYKNIMKILTIFWLISGFLLCSLQGGEITCGGKISAVDLKELRGLADYVGTQGIVMGKDTSKHEVFRHYRHKALLIDIVWIEDVKGVIKKLAIYHRSKDVETYDNVIFGEGIAIAFSTDSIHIKKLTSENSQN